MTIPIRCLLFASLTAVTSACGDASPSTKGTPLSSSPDAAVADAGTDPCPAGDASVTVVSQTLEGALLTLKLEFSGGCKDHGFSVGYGGAMSASSPPHIPLELNHYANGDLCEALLAREVIIDLSTLPGVEPPVRIDLVDPEGKGVPGAQAVLFEGAESPTERPEGTLTVRSECSHFTPL